SWKLDPLARQCLRCVVIRAHLVGRKQRHGRGLVRPSESAAPVLLPVHTETCAMGAPLPRHRLIQMKAPAGIQSSAGLAKGDDARRADHDSGGANSDASGTILLIGGKLIVTDEEIGETEVIHQRRPEYAGDTK